MRLASVSGSHQHRRLESFFGTWQNLLSSARERGPAFSGTRAFPRGGGGGRPRSSALLDRMRDRAAAEAGPVCPASRGTASEGVRGPGVVGERTVVVGEPVVAGADDHATEQLRHLHDALRTFCSIW